MEDSHFRQILDRFGFSWAGYRRVRKGVRNNLLTYYEDEIKMPSLTKVIDSLAPEGFLVIGSHERMPAEPADLKHWEESNHIFQKRP